MAVFEKVQEIIVEELGKDAEEVKVETTFDELDADSLDVFQVISEIEDEFDIQIETEEEHFFGESLNTDGSKGGLESGASAVISPYSDESDQPNPYMQMDGKAIFDFAVKTVSKSIKALVEEKGEPDYFLLHQANIRILDIMAKKIDVSRDKFLANMMSYGNTSAASIPILLSENVANGTLKLDSGQTILLSGFGGGLTWGSLIVKI